MENLFGKINYKLADKESAQKMAKNMYLGEMRSQSSQGINILAQNIKHVVPQHQRDHLLIRQFSETKYPAALGF